MKDDNQDNVDSRGKKRLYADERVELGLFNDGGGYIELEVDDGEFHTLSLTEGQITELEETLTNGEIPIWKRIPSDVSSPSGWSTGKVLHTGGNIWCRRFEKDLGELTAYVSYNVKFRDGVGLALEGEQRHHIMGLEQRSIFGDSDKAAVEVCRQLISDFESGLYDDAVEEAKESH
jgi:hypothetical protein